MLRTVLKDTAPVLFGYLPMGIAFGLLFQELGYPWYYATLMGLMIFAGSAQFLAIGLLTAGAGWIEVALSTFLLNARHLFYGLSMLKQYGQWGLRKLYLVFGLTDETFALLTTTEPPEGVEPARYYLWVTTLNQSYWVIGCTLGAWLGAVLPFNTEGIEFVITALFTVLLIEQWKRLRELTPLLVAAGAALLMIVLMPQQMLAGSILLALTMLAILHRIPRSSA